MHADEVPYSPTDAADDENPGELPLSAIFVMTALSEWNLRN